MIPLRKAALNACQDLASAIIGTLPDDNLTAWHRAHRIERRWRMQGATDYLVQAWKQRNAAFLQDQSERHDYQHPDRLTYLHR